MISQKALRDIQAALTKGGREYEVEDVLADLDSGDAQLWATDTATVVTQIAQHANYRSFEVWLAGGELAGVLDLLEVGEDFARASGCSLMEVRGRRGWKRVLAPHGFNETAVVLSKEL